MVVSLNGLFYPHMEVAPKPAPTSDRQYIMLAFRIMGDFGVGLAVPVVTFALVGKWLDMRFGTRPWFLIAGFILAAGISATYVNRRAKMYGREYEEMGKNEMKKE